MQRRVYKRKTKMRSIVGLHSVAETVELNRDLLVVWRHNRVFFAKCRKFAIEKENYMQLFLKISHCVV